MLVERLKTGEMTAALPREERARLGLPPVPPGRGDEYIFVVNQNFLASYVGLIGVGLPILLFLSSFGTICDYDSLSHYYFAPVVGDLFVGAMAVIGALMLAYKGRAIWESRLANFAGVCAFGLALAPTTGDGCESGVALVRHFALLANGAPVEGMLEPFLLFDQAGLVHGAFAGALFSALLIYTLFVFPRVEDARHRVGGAPGGPLTRAKRRRNVLYYASGAVMAASVLSVVVALAAGWDECAEWRRLNVTFWLEAAALVAFGASWLVRGHVFDKALADG